MGSIKEITVEDVIKAYMEHGVTVRIENGSVIGFEVDIHVKKKIRKEEVESVLGFEIPNCLFNMAYQDALRKQMHIFYRVDRREVVLQDWYLIKLTVEYVRIILFQIELEERNLAINEKKRTHQGSPAQPHCSKSC